MKITKTNFIKVMEAMSENAHAVKDILKDDKEMFDRYQSKCSVLTQIVMMLKDEEFFNAIADIYLKERK